MSLLPDSPGVYQYFDKEGNIIYVGKAKNLKRRVSSYFNKTHESLRTTMLVRNICDIKYTVVSCEEDALHLENSFIKEYRPRYNVLLKDDKTILASPVIRQTTYYGAGVGFVLARGVLLDVAYQYLSSDLTDYYLFYAQDNTGMTESARYSTSINRHNVAVTLGFRF